MNGMNGIIRQLIKCGAHVLVLPQVGKTTELLRTESLLMDRKVTEASVHPQEIFH